mmetsp:Transcript_11776/g.11736  ORF Transcript_11776/g.11736 Transcript_11776/m.11736 type:complete len:138 (+) Transcript_11776:2522-2935(+)
MIKLLREGRTSIVTSFAVFKFIALYSMIQFITVIMLYALGANLGDWQYLYIDLFILIPMSITMSRTGAHKTLSKVLPLGELISFQNLASVISQIVIQASFQVTIFFILRTQGWFESFDPNPDKDVLSYENTTLFLLS